MRHRNDIDGLRCVAVLPVVCFHYDIYWPALGIMVAPGGFVGVDIFFVISGFLITGIIFEEIKADDGPPVYPVTRI
jgi:peptidoglycan/LPS O-acetylase OafA/YrhL